LVDLVDLGASESWLPGSLNLSFCLHFLIYSKIGAAVWTSVLGVLAVVHAEWNETASEWTEEAGDEAGDPGECTRGEFDFCGDVGTTTGTGHVG